MSVFHWLPRLANGRNALFDPFVYEAFPLLFCISMTAFISFSKRSMFFLP